MQLLQRSDVSRLIVPKSIANNFVDIQRTPSCDHTMQVVGVDTLRELVDAVFF